MHLVQAAIKAMVDDAEQSFPDECCGFLFGRETTEQRVILQATPVHNAKEGDKRRRFVITAKDYLKAEQYAEQYDLLLLGVYHSHPDHPAIPSEHDRVAAQPFFSYVILSVLAGSFAVLRSWRLSDDMQFEEEPIFDQQLH